MCIQDFTLHQCGCQTKGRLRVCGEFQCSHIKDIAKQLPDFCDSCQEKLDRGDALPQRRTSTVKRIKRSLSMRIGPKSPTFGGRGHRSSSHGSEAEWVNPFNDPV
ncbi:hypothetical protein Dda_5187 [Drechslerella dactyloides]|uniref:Uncharacterized protein n=1 Tax=Drechslerella dactyloides TaxID=74499 RepID=A0AAD6IVL9_DREDA|nr:hypothetical protein Dda_5187 [Drechslerella dactyloides]